MIGMMIQDVVIVGAGPVGLFLAIELATAGVKPLLLERLAEPDRTIKAASVGAVAAEALERRGLEHSLRPRRRRPARRHAREGPAPHARRRQRKTALRPDGERRRPLHLAFGTLTPARRTICTHQGRPIDARPSRRLHRVDRRFVKAARRRARALVSQIFRHTSSSTRMGRRLDPLSKSSGRMPYVADEMPAAGNPEVLGVQRLSYLSFLSTWLLTPRGGRRRRIVFVLASPPPQRGKARPCFRTARHRACT